MATPSAKAKAIGQRGKGTEAIAQKLFEHLNNTIMNFAFERLPDARAAGGRLKAQICDFLAWWQFLGGDGQHHQISYQIEIKELSHDFRLPADKLGQLARMRKVRRAGGVGIVVVYHTKSFLWRAMPLEFFAGEIPPSWDLREVRTYATIDEALNQCDVIFPHIAR